MTKTFLTAWLGGLATGLVIGGLISWVVTSIHFYSLIIK
jgi:predicted lipid-binding transport protein (Tim44 family)